MIHFDMGNFSERLRELRSEKGETQLELGRIVRVSKMAVSHWEAGHSEPSIAQLILLAEHFGVSVDDLIGRGD